MRPNRAGLGNERHGPLKLPAELREGPALAALSGSHPCTFAQCARAQGCSSASAWLFTGDVCKQPSCGDLSISTCAQPSLGLTFSSSSSKFSLYPSFSRKSSSSLSLETCKGRDCGSEKRTLKVANEGGSSSPQPLLHLD